jgi:hypothetical protein
MTAQPQRGPEFDTHIPQWFGSTGSEPAEVLSVFGPQGERMHARSRPASNQTATQT